MYERVLTLRHGAPIEIGYTVSVSSKTCLSFLILIRGHQALNIHVQMSDIDGYFLNIEMFDVRMFASFQMFESWNAQMFANIRMSLHSNVRMFEC